MIPEELLTPCIKWVDGYTKDLDEIRWDDVEASLCAHLIDSGLLPFKMPCGCCELAAVGIAVAYVDGQYVIEFKTIRRPIRSKLH